MWLVLIIGMVVDYLCPRSGAEKLGAYASIIHSGHLGVPCMHSWTFKLFSLHSYFPVGFLLSFPMLHSKTVQVLMCAFFGGPVEYY